MSAIWFVVILSVIPFTLHLFGVQVWVTNAEINLSELVDLSPGEQELLLYQARSAAFLYTVMEWTAFCIASFTVVLAFTHYSMAHDVTTPIIGTALFFSGVMDAVHILAADHLIGHVVSNQQFIPFTWAISRTFNACIMIIGAGMFLGKGRIRLFSRRSSGKLLIFLAPTFFGLVAFTIIYLCSVSRDLPQALFPDSIIPRPWDTPPLILFLLAGGLVFPAFHRRNPSLFSHALLLSVIPHLFAQIHAAFGSSALFDAHFYSAVFLKNVGYLVPLIGLILDYLRAYQAEASLLATEEQLRVARTVQQGLLPDSAPGLDGYEIAGISNPARHVGGDYFDYLKLSDGCQAVVIADVSGHDMGASILMSQTRAYLRALSQMDASIGQMLTDLNRFLLADVKDTRFVSLFILRIDAETKQLSYAAAGHNGFVLNRDGKLRELTNTGPLLGVLESNVYSAKAIEGLSVGDLLLISTDGIVETPAPGGEQFGLSRLQSALQELREQPAQEIVDTLYEKVCEYGQQSPEDDITAVVLKIV